MKQYFSVCKILSICCLFIILISCQENNTVMSPSSSLSTQSLIKPYTDQVTFKFKFPEPLFKTQGLDINQIQNLKAFLWGPGINGQMTIEGYVEVLKDPNNPTTFTMNNIPKGPTRIVQVVAYDNSSPPQPIPGAVLYEAYRSSQKDNTVFLHFKFASNPAALILDALLKTNPMLANTIDLDQLKAWLNLQMYGKSNPDNTDTLLIHPTTLDTAVIARQIEQNPDILSEPPTSTSTFSTGTTLTLQNNQGVVVSGLKVAINDPASTETTTNGAGQANFTKITPGDWKLSIKGQSNLPFTIKPDGTITSSLDFSLPLKLPWGDFDWKYQKQLIIDNTTGGALTNYQINVVLDNSNTTFWNQVNSSGNDIRFIASDRTTSYDYWVESFNTTSKQASFWIKIPSIGANTQQPIYLFHGNVNATNNQNYNNVMHKIPNATNGLIGLWHLDSGTGSTVTDVSGNGFNGSFQMGGSKNIRVLVIENRNSVGNNIINSLKALDFEVVQDLGVTSVPQVAAYNPDLVLASASAWSTGKASLLNALYDAGYAIINDGNDTGATIRPVTSITGGSNLCSGPAMNPQTAHPITNQVAPLNHACGDSQAYITGIHPSAVSLYKDPSNTYHMGVYLEEPGKGKWYTHRYLASSSYYNDRFLMNLVYHLTGQTLPNNWQQSPDWTGTDGGQWRDVSQSFATGDALRFACPSCGTSSPGHFVQIPNSVALNPTTAISMEAWVKPSAGDYRTILSKGYTNLSYALRITRDSEPIRAFMKLENNVGATVAVGLSNNISNDQWYHLAGTYDGTTARFYVNGVLNDSQTLAGPLATNTLPLRFGRLSTATAGNTEHFIGDMDEIALYNRALSAAEVKAHAERRLFANNPPVITTENSTSTQLWQ